jgi:hypothetical protein
MASGAQASGFGEAAQLQRQTDKEVLALQKQIYEQGREDLAPYRELGYAALDAYAGELGFTRAEQPQTQGPAAVQQYRQETYLDLPPGAEFGTDNTMDRGPIRGYWLPNGGGFVPEEEAKQRFTRIRMVPETVTQPGSAMAPPAYEKTGGFETTPGYAFRMQEGINAIDRSAAARGRLNSGALVKRATAFGQGLGAEEYDKYLARISGLAGVGQSAVGSGNALASNYAANAGNQMQTSANALSNYAIGSANARASGYVGASNALTGAVNSGISNYLLFNALQG